MNQPSLLTFNYHWDTLPAVPQDLAQLYRKNQALYIGDVSLKSPID
jgi:CMP-N-acetylneuraminic acid synthetase